MKPKTSTAEDDPRCVISTQARVNGDSMARAKTLAKEIIPSSRDSIALKKTIGAYLKDEATTRF